MPTKPRTLAEVRALAARMQLHDADRAFAQREEVERLCATVELLAEGLARLNLTCVRGLWQTPCGKCGPCLADALLAAVDRKGEG